MKFGFGATVFQEVVVPYYEDFLGPPEMMYSLWVPRAVLEILNALCRKKKKVFKY